MVVEGAAGAPTYLACVAKRACRNLQARRVWFGRDEGLQVAANPTKPTFLFLSPFTKYLGRRCSNHGQPSPAGADPPSATQPEHRPAPLPGRTIPSRLHHLRSRLQLASQPQLGIHTWPAGTTAAFPVPGGDYRKLCRLSPQRAVTQPDLTSHRHGTGNNGNHGVSHVHLGCIGLVFPCFYVPFHEPF